MSPRLDGAREASLSRWLAFTPFILQKSRMRRRARTDLCGGRSAMGVPTATVSGSWVEMSVLPTNWPPQPDDSLGAVPTGRTVCLYLESPCVDFGRELNRRARKFLGWGPENNPVLIGC